MASTQRVWIGTIAGVALASNGIGIAVGARLTHPLPKHPVAMAAPSPDSEIFEKKAESFRAVAKKVGSSVLTIKTTVDRSPLRRGEPDDRHSFEEMLKQFGFRFQGPPPSGSPQRGGTGSGFLVDAQGHIVTNYHVVKDASKIMVTVSEPEEEVPARLIGSDPHTDLAVLKIDPRSSLPYLEWADSETVEVGDAAVAIGSPFNLSHSVTAGIVSAKGRNATQLLGSGFGHDLLQTDAAINPGNSGGPLCTIDGKVMGVNTAIFTQSGGYMGIGFAIPASTAKAVTDVLIRDGKIVRGWLGVSIQNANADMAKDLGLTQAVVVHEVQPHSPAEKAGLNAGDVILEVGGEPVKKVEDLQKKITAFKPGDRATLQVMNYHRMQKRTVQVVIGENT